MTPPLTATAFLVSTSSTFFSKTTIKHSRSTVAPRRLILAVTASPHHIPDLSKLSSPLTNAYPTHLLTVVTPHETNPSPQLTQLSQHIQHFDGFVHLPRQLAPHALEVPITLPPTADLHTLRTKLFHTARPTSADAVLQHISLARAEKRLAVFDLDSTLIAQETIDELASELNVQQQVKSITHRAMNGEIAFREALQARVALLKGLPVKALDGVRNRVRFTPGARDLIAALGALNCKTAVVSGGFHFLADHVRDVLGLDYSFANRLETDSDNVLTGRTEGQVVDAEFKANTLSNLANLHDVTQESILAVGDGSNDLLMMNRAGLGVAFNAKPSVQDRAQHRINQTSLKSILYLLGRSDDDIDALLTRANKARTTTRS